MINVVGGCHWRNLADIKYCKQVRMRGEVWREDSGFSLKNADHFPCKEILVPLAKKLISRLQSLNVMVSLDLTYKSWHKNFNFESA